jgi:hypothetical protein
MVLVNTEDSMISPGDSAREGGGVNIPVVGIRSSDLATLIECEEEPTKVCLTFKPIAPLTARQRRHLRALSSLWAKEGRLQEVIHAQRERERERERENTHTHTHIARTRR